MMSDAHTRLLAARFIKAETSEESIKQIEAAWISFFGPMKTLAVDEYRVVASDAMREWATDHGIQLVISPGQSHTRLAILERRHQVTRRAISLFLESNPGVAAEKDALIIALTYIVPQLNRIPNVHGYSPIQWGWATRHMCPACCLTNLPSAIQHTWTPPRSSWRSCACEKRPTKPRLRPTLTSALDVPFAKAHGLTSCSSTRRLVLLLERHSSRIHCNVDMGGPAAVIRREQGHGHHTDIYWITHGTVLLNAAPEHSKAATPVQDLTERPRNPGTQPSSLCQTSEAVV